MKELFIKIFSSAWCIVLSVFRLFVPNCIMKKTYFKSLAVCTVHTLPIFEIGFNSATFSPHSFLYSPLRPRVYYFICTVGISTVLSNLPPLRPHSGEATGRDSTQEVWSMVAVDCRPPHLLLDLQHILYRPPHLLLDHHTCSQTSF